MKEKQTETRRFRFNIIDVLVIAVLVAVAVILVIKVQAMKAERDANSTNVVLPISGPVEDFVPNMEFEALAEGLPRDVAEKIVADTSNRVYNSTKLLDAYVTEATLEPYYITAVSEDGTAYTVEDPQYANVRFVVQASSTDATSNVFGNFNPILGSQEIRMGKNYTLKTMSYELVTTITRVEALPNG